MTHAAFLTLAALATTSPEPSLGRLILGGVQYLAGGALVAWLTYKLGRRLTRLDDGVARDAGSAGARTFTAAVAAGPAAAVLDRLATSTTTREGDATVVRRALDLSGEELAAMTPEQRQALLRELGSALGVSHLLERAAADGTLHVVAETRTSTRVIPGGATAGADAFRAPHAPQAPQAPPAPARPALLGGTQLTAEVPAGASTFPCLVCGATLTRGAAAMTTGVICPSCRAVSRVAAEGDHFRVTTTRGGAGAPRE
jgi:hypothetical protein